MPADIQTSTASIRKTVFKNTCNKLRSTPEAHSSAWGKRLPQQARTCAKLYAMLVAHCRAFNKQKTYIYMVGGPRVSGRPTGQVTVWVQGFHAPPVMVYMGRMIWQPSGEVRQRGGAAAKRGVVRQSGWPCGPWVPWGHGAHGARGRGAQYPHPHPTTHRGKRGGIHHQSRG